MVNERTLWLIGIGLFVVFFGSRWYYTAKFNFIKGKMDEIFGELTSKYLELIAMNLALTTKLKLYEEKYGSITGEEDFENDDKINALLEQIGIANPMVNDSRKG